MILSCNNIEKTFIDNHVIKNVLFISKIMKKPLLLVLMRRQVNLAQNYHTGIYLRNAGVVTFAKDKSFG